MKTLLLLILSYTIAFGNGPSSMKSYIEKSGKEPSKFIIEKFKENDQVIFSETHKLKHEFDFITSLLPILKNEGVNTLAIEFGMAADQFKMDKLLNSSVFNTDLAIEIMRNYREDGISGYKEYLNLYKAAWALNQSTSNKFKIVLLGGLKSSVDLPGKTLIVAKNVKYDKAYSIVFHTAVQKEMDEAFDLLSNKSPIAFDIKGSPIKLNCDGYVYLKPHEDFEPLTWIDGFIDDSYMPVVKKYYKYLNIETLEYANDICKANDWSAYELSRGTKLN